MSSHLMITIITISRGLFLNGIEYILPFTRVMHALIFMCWHDYRPQAWSKQSSQFPVPTVSTVTSMAIIAAAVPSLTQTDPDLL